MKRVFGIFVCLIVLAACSGENEVASTAPPSPTTAATVTTAVITTTAATTTTATVPVATVVDDGLPRYSEVVATYPAGTELCTTHAGISGGGEGYSLGGYDGQGATLQIRNGETLAWCYGAKYVVTGPMVDEDGEPIPVGALLTLDTDFQFIQVSSFD